jgi:molybdopterin synthase catalytic subunit
LWPVAANLRLVVPPATGETWLGLTDGALDIGALYQWCVLPSCGAVVLFSGTVRDHADGRNDVVSLTYEAYEEHVTPRLQAIAEEIRQRWPSAGRVALWHRVGRLGLGESSVVVAVSTPHRPEAFDAARFGIDALKASVPIWKREEWNEGADWALGAQHITSANEVGRS